MLKEIALDLKRYSTPERLGSLVQDTASLAIEASTNDKLPRVNPHFYVKRGEDYVIAPGRDKRDVINMFAEGDPATTAAKEIRNMLLNDKGNFAYVWISPSGEWPESRVEIGAKKTKRNGEVEYLKCYGISTSLSPEACLETAQLLVSISEKNHIYPQSPDDLKSLAIKIQIPEGIDPFEYLSKLINFPEQNRWSSILTSVADKNKAKAMKAAVIATESVRLNPHVIYSSPIEWGAYIETRMKYEGFGMDPERFGCGGSNITSTSSNGISYTETNTLNFGYEDQFGSLQFSCPKCGATNTRPFGQLLSNCQHCNGDVTC